MYVTKNTIHGVIGNYGHPLQLGHCISWRENAQINHFGCEHEIFGYDFWTMSDQNPLVANHNDFFMHFLPMCCNGQATTNNCNGQVFF